MLDREIQQAFSSPSGKYTLLVSYPDAKTTAWRSCGEVSEGGRKIATVQRNYASFWYLFVENHPSGKDYLVCGADYQGQTVIDLSTGERADYLPPEAKEGAGWCFIGATYSAVGNLLLAEGCYWAAPYEWRLYDFSDPMKSLPHIGPDLWFDNEGDFGIPPEIQADGTIKFYEARQDEDDESLITMVAWRLVKRDGLKLTEVENWVDPAEQKRRDERDVAMKAYEEAWAKFRETDPYWLRISAFKKENDLPDKPYSAGQGVCYDGWHPDWKDSSESRVTRKVFASTEGSFEIEWGRTRAPFIYNRMYTDIPKRYFPRSAEALEEILADIKANLPKRDFWTILSTDVAKSKDRIQYTNGIHIVSELGDHGFILCGAKADIDKWLIKATEAQLSP